MHGGTVYGSEANAPTFGARTQSLAVACRAAESLRSAMAWVANKVAAISAADTKVILIICFSIWWQEPRKSSAPVMKSSQLWEKFHHALSTKRELALSVPNPA